MTAKFGLLIGAKVTGQNDIKKLGNSMQGVQGKAKNLGMAVRGVGAAFKGLLAIAAVGGIAALGKSLLDSADAFGKLSVRTGIAAGTLMAYVNAGKLADVSQSEIETGLRKLAQTQVEAAEGVKTYAEAYGKLGISVKKADGSLKPSDKLLGEIADKFARLPDGPEKAAVAMDIFGRSGAKLITLLNGGSESLEKFSVNVSDNFAKNAERFNDQIAEIGIKFNELGAVLLDAMLPALNAVALAFRTFLENVTKNLPVILEAFGFMTKAAVLFGSAMVGIAAGKAFAALITNLNTIVKITRTLFNLEKARLVIQQGIVALQAAAASLGKGGQIGAILGVGAGAAAIVGTQKLIDQLFQNIEERFEGLGGDGAGTGLGAVTLPDTQFSPIVTADSTSTGGASEQNIGTRLGMQVLQQAQSARDLVASRREENKFLELSLTKGREFAEVTREVTDLVNKGVPFSEAFDLVTAKRNMQEQLTTAEQLNQTFDGIKTSIKDGLVNGLTDAIVQGKSLGSVMSGLLRQAASLFINFGLRQILPFADGGVISQGKVTPFAYGGVVNKPTLFPMANGMGLMGESGAEAIMPLRRGRSGRLGVEAAGGGATTVNVSVDASGSSVQGDGAQAAQLGKAIGFAVQTEILKQKRPGGLLATV